MIIEIDELGEFRVGFGRMVAETEETLSGDSLARASGRAGDPAEDDAARLAQLKPWKRNFILKLREVPSIEKARLAGEVSRKTAYAQREADELFRELWDEAIEGHVDKAEESLYDLATVGDVRRTYREGEMVTEDFRRDSQALRFLLSGNRPKTYREDRGTTVNVGVALNLELNSVMDRLRSPGVPLTENGGKLVEAEVITPQPERLKD